MSDAADGTRARLAIGAAWIVGARALTSLASVVGTVVIARILGPADFGMTAIAAAVVAIVVGATELSLPQALVRHPSPSPALVSTAWTLGLLRCLALGAALLAAAPGIASLYSDARLIPVLAVLAAGVAVGGLANPQAALPTRELRFGQQVGMQLAEAGAVLLVSVAVAVATASPLAPALGYAAGRVAQAVASHFIRPFRPRPSLQHARELLHFSGWLGLGMLVRTLSWRLDQLLVGGQLGPAPLGHYAVGSRLAATASREIATPLTSVLFPALARVASRREWLAESADRAQAVAAAVALPVGVGAAFIAEPFVVLAMGEPWRPAAVVIEWIAPVFALQALGALAEPAAMATGQTRRLFRRDLQSSLLRLPLIVAGVLLGGLAGLLQARVAAGALATWLNARLLRDVTGLSIQRQLLCSLRSIIAVAAMAAVLAVTRGFMPPAIAAAELLGQLALLVAVGAAAYGLAHGLAWRVAGCPDGPEREALAVLSRIQRRRGTQ